MSGDDVYYCPFPVFHLSGMLPLAWLGFPGGQVVLRDSFKTQFFWDDIRSFGLHGHRPDPGDDELAARPAASAGRPGQPPALRRRGPGRVPRSRSSRSASAYRCGRNFGNTEVGTPLYAGPDVTADRESTGKWVTPGYQVRVADENDYEVPTGADRRTAGAHR